VGRLPKADGDPEGRSSLRPPGHTNQVHTGLLRRTASLAAIASDAAGDDVLPVLPAALRGRDDMVQGPGAGRQRLAAILAGVFVPGVDVQARERHVVELTLDSDEPQEPDDGRQLETERDGPDLTVVDRDDLDLSLAPERDRFLPVDDLEGFVRCV